MRYAAVAKFNREQSLHAMWQAFCARSFADQQLVELDAGVVRDLLNARYYAAAQGQFISQDPVFWELGLTQDGKGALLNPQALNSYGYANDNPITGKDPNGRQYTNVSVGFAVPVYGAPIGPVGGIYYTPNDNPSDPYITFGIGISNRPGPSGSITYSPSGSPTEGLSASVSGFYKAVGGQGGLVDKMRYSREYGIGTQGVAGSITYTVRVSKVVDALFGPLENVTTPMTLRPTLYNQNPSRRNQLSFATPTMYTSVSARGNTNFSALSSASASISGATAAISRGDYATASKYLQTASNLLK